MSKLLPLFMVLHDAAERHGISFSLDGVPEDQVPEGYELKQTFADGAKLYRKVFDNKRYVVIITKGKKPAFVSEQSDD